MTKELTGDYRKYMDKSFLGAWDVPDGGDLVLTIDYVSQDEVQNEKGRQNKMTLHFIERDYKPMICNKTNAEAISNAYKSRRVEDWKNKKISIYKATISAFGSTQECLRIRDYAPKSEDIYCECCGELITDHDRYKAKAIANNALTKFGRYLCWDCAQKVKEEQDGAE